MSRTPHRHVYTVVTTQKRGEEPRDFWLKIGASWLNRDGSETITLNALPLNGKLVLREPREQNDEESADEPVFP